MSSIRQCRSIQFILPRTDIRVLNADCCLTASPPSKIYSKNPPRDKNLPRHRAHLFHVRGCHSDRKPHPKSHTSASLRRWCTRHPKRRYSWLVVLELPATFPRQLSRGDRTLPCAEPGGRNCGGP